MITSIIEKQKVQFRYTLGTKSVISSNHIITQWQPSVRATQLNYNQKKYNSTLDTVLFSHLKITTRQRSRTQGSETRTYYTSPDRFKPPTLLPLTKTKKQINNELKTQ